MSTVRTAGVILGGIIAIVGGYLVVRSTGTTNTFNEIRESRESESQAATAVTSDAIKQLGAVTYWAGERMQFTADVRRVLIREDKRPVFFVGRIRDIDKSADSYVVTFDSMRNLAVIAAISDVRMTRDDPGTFAMELNRHYTATGECLFVERLQ